MAEETMSVPVFKYHPDPVKTGAVVPTEEPCRCCGRSRGFAYKNDPYGLHSNLAGMLCPWCIWDGSAHEKFDVTFADDHALERAGLDRAVIEEVTERTPGFETWQGEEWLSHCGDACAFLGDATKSDLSRFAEEKALVVGADDWDEHGIRKLLAYYEPGGSPAFYRFACCHCGQILYAVDCD